MYKALQFADGGREHGADVRSCNGRTVEREEGEAHAERSAILAFSLVYPPDEASARSLAHLGLRDDELSIEKLVKCLLLDAICLSLVEMRQDNGFQCTLFDPSAYGGIIHA